MALLNSPGVLVREFEIPPPTISAPTSSGAHVAVFEWGPVYQRTLIDSENNYAATFFKPSNFNAESWFVGANFLAYTDSLWVVRAADTTGNTAEVVYSGNVTNPAIVQGTNVLQLSNTDGLAVGQKLLFSNAVGLAAGAVITEVNSTSVTIDTPATANILSIDAVFRDDVSYTAAALQSDLNYDASDITDWDSLVVKNEHDYATREGGFDPAALYVARFPGKPGDSLRVAVCDTPTQFKSNTSLSPNSQFGGALVCGVAGVVGSNTLTVSVGPANTANANQVTSANTLAQSVQQSLTVGDLIEVGNTKIGFQFLQVTSIGTVTATSNVYSFTLTVDDKFKLSSNVSTPYLARYWEFYKSIELAPGQSDYQRLHGNTSAYDEMHVVVVDEGGRFSGSPGTIIEKFENVSRATDAKSAENLSTYYKNVINSKSKYIWWANDRTTAPSATAQFLATSTATKPLDMRMVGGSSGLDEANVPVGTIALGWDLFQSNEEVPDISLLLAGKARGEAISAKTQLANYILDNVATKRNPQDCVLFVSPDIDDVVNNVGEELYDTLDFEANMEATSYAFMDSGYKYMYDKYNDVNRWVPLNGDIAGLAARCDLTHASWWSFAGTNRGQIKNCIRLAWNPRQSQRDELYKAGINPVISSAGKGTYLFGDKTLIGKHSAFDRINVRRLFITLEKSIWKSAQDELFEFNDDYTRANFRNMVTPYLRDVKGQRGVYDFKVVCDGTNNTPEVIDANEFRAAIYIKPAKSINFIILDFVATPTGVAFSEIIGSYA